MNNEQSFLQSFIDRVLVGEVEKSLSGTNLLIKTLIGMKPTEEVEQKVGDEVIQAVPQARYLKNIIGHEVGLADRAVFDNGSQVLYKSLLMHSKQEIMHEFDRHFPPHLVLSAFECEINIALKEKDSDIDFMTLSEYISAEQKPVAFDFDTKTEGVSITTLGVIALLKHFGVMQ